MSDRDRLERALDDALRDIVSGEAPQHLRRGVMSRISTASRRPAFPVRLVWAAALSAIVAAVAFWLWRPDREDHVTRHVAGATPSAPPESAPPVPPQPAAAPIVKAARQRVVRPETSVESVPFDSLIRALPAPVPVDASPLQDEGLVIRRMVIPSLEVTHLGIEPLEPS